MPNIFRQLPMLAIRFEKLDASKHRISQNICVKKLIVPPKNIPCFDAHKEWPYIRSVSVIIESYQRGNGTPVGVRVVVISVGERR